MLSISSILVCPEFSIQFSDFDYFWIVATTLSTASTTDFSCKVLKYFHEDIASLIIACLLPKVLFRYLKFYF